MGAPLRGQGNPVSASELLATMADAPWKHDFLQALRTLEASFANKPRFGTARKPADELVRLAQAPELSFAPSTLSAVHLADAQGPPRIEVRFFGLFGPNGPLPSHLTEYARERLLHHSDPTFARFADIFHHRLLLLFYRAWAQAQPTANLDRPNDDRFGHQVGSLIGLGTPLHRNRDAAPDHAKLFFSGYLARQARHSDGLRSMLSAYLRMPVTVESFVGQWLELPANERTRIGRAGSGSRTPTSKLGAGAVLGRRVFDRQHNFRIHVGPVGLTEFETLLPGGSALAAVQALVRHYVGLELGWGLRLQLAAAERPASRPGQFGRLGWTSWIGRREAETTRIRQRENLPEPVLLLRSDSRLPARHEAHNGAH